MPSTAQFTSQPPTSFDVSSRILMSPLDVGPLHLRNRLITTGHGAFFPWRLSDPGTQFIEYQRRRAAGGLGLIIAQPIMVEPGHDWPSPLAQRMADVADAIHGEGAHTILQLSNFGAALNSSYNQGGRPLWSFNGAASPSGEPSHRMTADEVEEMIEGHAHAARVATEAGFDGVELHGAHGYLLHQSISPWGNGRDDEWGEPLAFVRALIAAVRAAIGPDKAIGYRMPVLDTRRPEDGAMTEAELHAAAVGIVATGEINLMNMGVGSVAPNYSTIACATYRAVPGVDLHRAAALRAAIGAAVPVVGIGRILTPEQAESALRRGDCDLVAMTRGHIADPDIAAKTARGESRRIRPCVGANECNDRKLAGGVIACFHNPDIGRDPAVLVPATSPRRVLVIGAGPAGLKAAEIAARRGHDVTVVDAAFEPGGALGYVRHTAARELFGAVRWLVDELELLDVKIMCGLTVTEEVIGELRPDHVILATGAGRSVDSSWSDGNSTPVLGVDALAAELGSHVLVYDALGQAEGGLIAERLAERGHRVTFSTPFETVIPQAGYTIRDTVTQAFRALGIAVVASTRIVGGDSTGDVAGILALDPENRPVDLPAHDTLVVVPVPRPAVELVEVLDRLAIGYTVVGDALAPRGVTTAMIEADTAAREV